MSWVSQFLGGLKPTKPAAEQKQQQETIPFKPGWPFFAVIQGSRTEIDYTQSHPIEALQALIDRKEAKGWRIVSIMPTHGMPGNVTITWARDASQPKQQSAA